MEEWSALCRCCLAPGSDTSLVEDEDVRSKFYETTSIEVKEEDGLPQRLCGDCAASMNSAHQFRRQCLRIDSELKSQLEELANLTQQGDNELEEQIAVDATEDHGEVRNALEGGETSLLLESNDMHIDLQNETKYAAQHKDPCAGNEDTVHDVVGQSGGQQGDSNPEMIVPEIMIKSEPVESDDDCYYVLVIDDSKEKSEVKVKDEPKELNPATGEMEFEKSIESFLLTKPLKNNNDEEHQSFNMIFDKETQQYHFTDEQDGNDSEDNSNIELTQVGSINGSLLSNGENGNIIKILTANGTTENLLFKGDKGDEIVTYIMDNQFVSGESDSLSQEEVIVCEGDDSQFQIVNYDGSELVIEYTDEGEIASTVIRQEDGSFVCSCGLLFDDYIEYENHQIVHASDTTHPCSLCGKAFESAEILTGHMLLHNNASANIQCPFCRQNVKRNSITQHIKFSHNNIKPCCSVCSKTFANPNNLKRHMMIHSGVREFECDLCLQRFHQKITMQTHRMTHMTEPLFCSRCNITFDRHSEMFAHKRQHKPNGGAQLTFESVNAKERTLGYPCSFCQKIFSVESALRTHVENAHTHDPMELLCSECGEVLPSRKAMCAHTFMHRSARLKGGKRYECKTCNKACASQAMLIMHERVHTNERPFPCPLCALRFKTKTHLRTHQLTHTREKKFGCSVCMKFFALKGNLVVHLRTHTGERPYVCSLCNDSFIDSKYLKKHKLRKHSIENAHWNRY